MSREDETRDAIEQLYADAIAIYERARDEVVIVEEDGRTRPYVPMRYKQAVDRGYRANALVPAIARIVRTRTEGFGRLEEARRPDLMVETLVLDETKPYHRLFSAPTIAVCRERMAAYEREFGDLALDPYVPNAPASPFERGQLRGAGRRTT